MKGFLKFGICTILLTVLLSGILSFTGILPNPWETVVQAKTNVPPLEEEDLASEAPAPPEEVPSVDSPQQEGESETPGTDSEVDPQQPVEPPDVTEDEEDPVVVVPEKIVYLTFDDGPSPNITPHILDILKEYDVKASFFVIGNLAETHPELILRIQEEGHLVNNHTYTHQYKQVYSSTDALLAEFAKTDEVLTGILGENYTSKWVRFPGGSFGDKRKPFREAAAAAGYYNIDWNVLNGDAEGSNIGAAQLFKRFKETLQGKDRAVVLMHDSSTKKTTVEALPAIIEYLYSQGYQFKTLEDYAHDL